MSSVQAKHSYLAVVSIVGVIILWQLVCTLSSVPPSLVPSPTLVASALYSMVADGRLVSDIALSLGRALVGFMLGSIAGILCGLLTGRTQWARQSVAKIINALRPIPAIALVPLVIVWFGIGEVSKVVIVFWGVFFPVWISTHVGASSTNVEYLWLGRSLGASRLAAFLEIVLPGAATAILAGMRTGVSIAFVCLVAAEMAGASGGLGYRITVSHLTFRTDEMMAAIVTLGAVGALADRAFMLLVHRAFPWYARSQRGFQGD